MSDLDEGRDVRAAFGTLLADEPASPWSASDDVVRGRALQRRRRTRAGAGIGLVAAVVMVFGVFGPLRPQPTVVVPPAYQPPAVQGVDTEWLAALDRSFTAFNGPVVDWSRSTVKPTAGGGFTLELTLVGATVTAGGEDFTIEYAEPPGPAVARALVTWKPGGGEGPVLASCAAPACVRADRGISPGFAEDGGRWDADAAQLAGTFVVDRTYDDGAVLELASAPHPDLEGDWSPVMSYGGISFVLDRVGRPSDGAPSDDLYGMTALLATLGWTVDGVTTQRVPEGQPTLVTWAARRTGTTTDEAASILSVRTWDTSSWSAGEDGINPGSVISRCAATGTCLNAAVTATTCDAQDVCWSESSALLTKPIDDVEAGSWVLYRSNATAKLAVEIVVGRDNCPDVCAGDPYTAFLSEAETAQAAELVQATLLATPTPRPTPTPSSSDAVIRLLESLGHRVISADVRAGQPAGTSTVYSVDVDLNADNPVNASLTVTRVPAGVEVGSERVALSGVAMNSCDERTCTPVTSVTYPCPSSSCFQDWWAITTPAYTGLDQGTLLVFRSNGSQAVELVVGVPSCATCGTGPTVKAFLSLEDAQQVLNAIGLSAAGPTAPATVAACAPGDVKLIPKIGTPTEVTGGRGLWIEIHARNPQVDCLAAAPASVSFEAANGSALSFLLKAGIYQGSRAGLSADLTSREITQASGPARFALSKYRCDLPGFTTAARVYVTLEGWDAPAEVSLPQGSGIERCVGDQQAAGNTVWVSGLDG